MGMTHRFVTVAALALAGLAAASLATAGVPGLFADKRSNAIPVDVELVIAVDVSYSMDPEEQALQREGYILALTSKEFLQALRQGANGKIAITYFEWAGQFDQKVVMPWRVRHTGAPHAPRFQERCALPGRCLTKVATKACAG